MPPFLIPVLQTVAAAIAYDRIRPALARYVPRPAPPTYAQGGGRHVPPTIPGRTYPIWRQPMIDRDRRDG